MIRAKEKSMAHPMVVTKSPKSVTTLHKSETDLTDFSTQELYRELLSRFHEDPDRDGLLATPSRVEKAMNFLTQGYEQDPTQILRGALFDVDYDEMVIVKDVEMYSLCEHHMSTSLTSRMAKS